MAKYRKGVYVNARQTPTQRKTKYCLVKHFTKSVNLAKIMRDWENWNIRKLIINYNKIKAGADMFV